MASSSSSSSWFRWGDGVKRLSTDHGPDDGDDDDDVKSAPLQGNLFYLAKWDVYESDEIEWKTKRS